MNHSSAKNNILKKIRMALSHPTPLPFPRADANENVFQPLQQDLMVEFAEQFTRLQGKFDYCTSRLELAEHFEKLCTHNQWTKIYCNDTSLKYLVPADMLHHDISTCDAALTGCEFLVARTGSVVMSSTRQGRLPAVYAPVHICIASSSQLVYEVKEGLAGMQRRYANGLPSLITFATGPSRTADIEKTLVVGVHGPKEVYCFVQEDHPDAGTPR